MAITVKGIRLKSVNIGEQKDDGQREVTGSYDLMSNMDIPLAKQTFNGYGDIKITFTAETQKAFQAFLTGVKKDISMVLGLEEV